MDSKNNIDQLFREKLFSQEVTPSDAAWKSVSGQIHKKKPVVWYWVAASITLLLISIVLWPTQVPNDAQIIAQIDHPTITDDLRWFIPKQKTPAKVNSNPLAIQNAKQENQSTTDFQNEQPELKAIAEFSIALVAIQPSLTTDFPVSTAGPIGTYDKRTETGVKITYIVSNMEPAKEDTVKGFNKLWSVAQSLSPTTVLADIRDAKNNLFVRNAP